MLAIETNGITKKFGEITAVDNISLTVGQGEVFGLLGPNGAGKTTLISMLVTTKKMTGGSAKVNGFDVSRQSDEVRKSIGIVFQDNTLDEDLTAFENLELHAAMYGMQKEVREKRINEVIGIVELKDRLRDVVKTFSGGMRRRLEIARGLMHYPKILFLDEPTIGLDPQTRKHIWEHVKRIKKEHGITIVLTTHYMDEADGLCDRIAIIDHGKIIALDKPENLKNSLGGDIIRIRSGDDKKLEGLLKTLKEVKGTQSVGGEIIVRLENAEKRIADIVILAKEHKIHISSVSINKPTLDDVFLHYTGRTIRDAGEDAGKESMRMMMRAWGHRR